MTERDEVRRWWKKHLNRYRWECGEHQVYGAWRERERDARSDYWAEHSPNFCNMATAKIFHDTRGT